MVVQFIAMLVDNLVPMLSLPIYRHTTLVSAWVIHTVPDLGLVAHLVVT